VDAGLQADERIESDGRPTSASVRGTTEALIQARMTHSNKRTTEIHFVVFHGKFDGRNTAPSRISACSSHRLSHFTRE
jgi:hypothetical protein